MSKELNTGKYKSRVVRRTYGDGSNRWWLQVSFREGPFYDKGCFTQCGAALIAMDEFDLEKAQEHVVSEEGVG